MRTRSLPITVAGALAAAVALGGCDALRGFFNQPIDISQTPFPAISPTPGIQQTPSPTSPPLYFRTEVLTQFKQSPYLSLFTSHLINDGIGIFGATSDGATIGARRWGRDYKDPATPPPVDDQAEVYVAASGPFARALVVFKRRHDGTWLGDFPWRKSLVKKGFKEEFQREALFELGSGGWKLAGVSVATQRSTGGSVGITEVTIQNGAARTTYRKGALVEDRITRIENLANGLPGEQVLVTVTASAAADAFVLTGGNRRQRLTRDGTGGPPRFVGTVAFPDVQGIGQIGIDVVATRTLEVVASEYDATIWGVPVARKGGAL